jgi:anaerobic selenocysteine-containing dehydrogenase
LREAVRDFTPDLAAQRTGIPAETIRALAREFAGAEAAVAYGRVGACTQEFGGLAQWLVIALNAVTGNLDREGGFMFATPAADLIALANRTGDRGHFGVWKSRVRGLPEFGGELPAAALAEEIDTPGDGQIRALITVAGNPVLSTPNGARLNKALAGLEYMVSVDIYRNQTTRHADLILPTSFGFERDHYDLAFYLLSVRNAARYVKPLVSPPPGVRGDFEVMLDLALSLKRHGGGRKGSTLPLRVARLAGARRILDLMLRFGPYKLSLRKLEESPHGLDLGPLQAGRLTNVQLAPEIFLRDLERLKRPVAANGLVLIGRRTLRSNNSWMHNNQRLVKGPPRCTLMIHPDDAQARGLSAGSTVRIRSRVGTVEAPVSITSEVAQGVVSLPHGWGHASVNDLTDEQSIDALSGNAAFSGVPVEVEAAQRSPST